MATKELIGIVVSDKTTNTRIVAVNERNAHRNYKKVITRTKRYVVHDASFNTRIGDKVKIQETRPLSKTKRWLITNVLEKISI
uniref:ribosomal protein S17 n=1 Tax=Ochrosphaera neapolitana TaxID=35137 RepID=UPI00286B794B|nr:ribosomal protein S17 [Ochrosphaera neapolitana]WKK50129.1 ribosomal protein S17 [Ochrosphaera neapolitana]